jgi:L,D-peptidoglycan transpeptidase YkuD (ErfK/YbiS/YcfS/YnhG family)
MISSCLRLLLSALLTVIPLAAFELPSNSSQCLVGIADGWDSSKVTLTLYEKKGGAWKPAAEAWSGRLGKSGLVWGLGLHPVPAGGAVKKEGDLRAPAGVFEIGGAWGREPSIRKHPKLFYRQVTSRDLWVEDPGSDQYNRNVILKQEPATAWEKKQQMKQNDAAHVLKLFIAHNAPPKVVPNAGSSIFFHVWRGAGSRPTAGCTTMDEAKLRWLISSIDPTRRPIYVLLPKAEYGNYRDAWKLP